MVLLNSADVLCSFENSRAKIFVSRDYNKVFGVAKGLEKVLLVGK
jgi:hypothetical protein